MLADDPVDPVRIVDFIRVEVAKQIVDMGSDPSGGQVTDDAGRDPLIHDLESLRKPHQPGAHANYVVRQTVQRAHTVAHIGQ